MLNYPSLLRRQRQRQHRLVQLAVEAALRQVADVGAHLLPVGQAPAGGRAHLGYLRPVGGLLPGGELGEERLRAGLVAAGQGADVGGARVDEHDVADGGGAQGWVVTLFVERKWS